MCSNSHSNTDGLGLLEYLEWTEDMDITPVLAVYAGFSLDVWGQRGTSFPSDEMQFVLDEALDELEYCMGSVHTKYGALRASHGHPKPFKIDFVEIGNEDWFSATYPDRFPIMYNGIKAKYPNITLISTAFNEAPSQGFNYTIKIPKGGMWDTHHYEEPSYFLRNFNFYDNWQQDTDNEDVGILLGEYSVYQVDTPSGQINFSNPVDIHVPFPQMVSAIAEGVYALGGERNPNVVKMTSYAPSFMNRNWFNWTPDMISYTAMPNETVLSASYWQQSLFAHYRGTESLPVEAREGHINPLWWASSIEGDSTVFLKVTAFPYSPCALIANAILQVINSANFSVPLSVNLGASWESVNGTMMQNDNLHAFNSVENMEAVVPKALDIPSSPSGNGAFSWDVPKFSITVLQFDL